jgi:hypothetical protein
MTGSEADLVRMRQLRQTRLRRVELELTAARAERVRLHREALDDRAGVTRVRADLACVRTERLGLIGRSGAGILDELLLNREREQAVRGRLEQERSIRRAQLQDLRRAVHAVEDARRAFAAAVRSTEKWTELQSLFGDIARDRDR